MVTKMGYDWKSIQKNRYFVIKLGVSVLLVGFAFRLLYDRSSDFSQLPEAPFLQTTQISATPASEAVEDPIHTEEFGDESRESEDKCNLFGGEWIPYPAEPVYTHESCTFIEDPQNCLKNGRPDRDYLYWKWKPRGCDLPQLHPARFLKLMRNKTWAFVGDSISRNHVHSFLCILSMVDKAVEVYHDEHFKSRRWVLPKHNFTVSVIWSPLLVEAAIFEDNNGVSSSEVQVHLDRFDKNWTAQYMSWDYIVFSTGKWFTKPSIYYENGTIIGCHHCYTKNLTTVGLDIAFQKVLGNFLNHIIQSNHKGMIFYRASTPDHFENGEWFSGGTCKRKTPVKEGEFEPNELDKIIRDIEVQQLEKVLAKVARSGVQLKIFDVYPLSLMRPDGHPGPYRFFQPFAKDKNASVINDCLHWCLPGPIDSWNDLLMEMVVNG